MDKPELPSHPLCAALLVRYLPTFESLKMRLRARFPGAHFILVHHESKTGYPKFILYVECSFPCDVPGASDGLSISIDVRNLDTAPRINASVDWCCSDCPGDTDAPPPDWSLLMPADFCGEGPSPLADPGTLARLDADLPRLMASYEACVAKAFALIS